MRIALDHQIFTNQEVGGISRYYWELANQLNSLYQEVGVFAGFYQNIYLDNAREINIIGSKVNYPKNTIRIFQAMNSLITSRQIKNWKPDIIHETYYSSSLFSNYKSPRVVTVFDMIHELYKDEFEPRHLISKQKFKSIARANHLICISNSTKNDLMDIFDIDETKISVIYLGVNRSDFNFRCDISNNNSKPFLLYVGKRKGYKNFGSFLEAFARSCFLSKEFDVIAFGDVPFDKEELSKLKELGLNTDQVKHVVGDDHKLKELYSKASAFIYPSLYEGFGLPPLEAMASGCPVISSGTSSMPEVIGSAGEYFEPDNVESIIYAMEKVLFSKDRQEELIRKGYNNVEKFTWKKCAEDTLNVYTKMVK